MLEMMMKKMAKHLVSAVATHRATGCFAATLLLVCPALGGDWQALHEQAIDALASGDRAAARIHLLDAMEAADAAGVPHLFFEQSMLELARAQQRGGHYADAVAQYRRAYRVREARLGPWHAETAALLSELSLAFAAQRDFEHADVVARRVLQIQEKTLAPDHLDTAVTLYRLGNYAIERGRCAEAEAHLSRSLSITSGALDDGADLVTTLTTFASIQRARRRHDVADTLYRRALELQRTQASAADPRVQSLYSMLGSLCEEREQWRQAAVVYREAIDAAPGDHLAARLWWVTARSGERAAADRDLDRYVATRSAGADGAWSGKLLHHLLGQVDDETLMQAAEAPAGAEAMEQVCAANFYIGSRHLVSGQTELAAEHFRACLATEIRDAPEYQSAAAELERLDPAMRVTNVDQLPYDPNW